MTLYELTREPTVEEWAMFLDLLAEPHPMDGPAVLREVEEPVYRSNFGGPGDGMGLDDNEAYEAWLTLRGLVEDGWLVRIGGDDDDEA